MFHYRLFLTTLVWFFHTLQSRFEAEKTIESNEMKSFKGERRRLRRRKAINSFKIDANDVELFMKPHKKNLFVNTNCFQALVVQFQMTMTMLFYTFLRRAQQTNSRPFASEQVLRSFLYFLVVCLCFRVFIVWNSVVSQ